MSDVPATPSDLVRPEPAGLYCPRGDFAIDPIQRVPTAVITHAHGDHLRRGSGRYICAEPSVPLLRERLARSASIQGVPYGERFQLGDVTVSLHPAGHILGSAQVRIEAQGRVWVVSGDFKRQDDPTCAPFEIVPCDVLVTEATFAHPGFVFPEGRDVAREIHSWWLENRAAGRASLLFCYVLGKAQRILAELADLADRRVRVHAAFLPYVEIYRKAGVRMAETEPISKARSSDRFAGDLVLLPPAMHGSRPLKAYERPSHGFASGWMIDPAAAKSRGYDRGFTLSDHADFPSLVRTVEESGARRVVAVHGGAQSLEPALRERGIAIESWETVQVFEQPPPPPQPPDPSSS